MSSGSDREGNHGSAGFETAPSDPESRLMLTQSLPPEGALPDPLRQRSALPQNRASFRLGETERGVYSTTFKVYVRIPNEEIRKTFEARVMTRFSEANSEFVAYGRDFAKAALEGNADGMSDILVRLLENYVSVRDTATKATAENYYHGFLTALLSCAGAYARDLRSNSEAGDGYADWLFTSGTGSRRVGVVLEIKRCAVPEEMYDAAEAALKQIHNKRYTARLDRLRCGTQCVYGIAFCRKDYAVCGGVLVP